MSIWLSMWLKSTSVVIVLGFSVCFLAGMIARLLMKPDPDTREQEYQHQAARPGPSPGSDRWFEVEENERGQLR